MLVNKPAMSVPYSFDGTVQKIISAEVGIYKSKQESKKTRKQEIKTGPRK